MKRLLAELAYTLTVAAAVIAFVGGYCLGANAQLRADRVECGK